MTHSADHAEIAEQARRIYAEQLVKGLPAMVNSLAATASSLLDKPSEHARFMRRRELVHELKKGAAVWHKTMVNSLRNALLDGVSRVACRRSAAARRVQRPAVAGRRRHHRARDPDLAPGAGRDGPGRVGVHRPARAHVGAGAARGTRRAGHAARPRAGAHRRRCLALGRLQPGQLARAADRPARGAGRAGRGGLPRDQPLAGRAGRAARRGPAPVHQALAQRADAAGRPGRRWRRHPAMASSGFGAPRPGPGAELGLRPRTGRAWRRARRWHGRRCGQASGRALGRRPRAAPVAVRIRPTGPARMPAASGDGSFPAAAASAKRPA